MSDAAATPKDSVGHRIVRAMFVIIFFQFFWKFGGLIITLLVGSVFGSSPESDAYFFVTETVVFLLQTLCLKIFIPVMVPIFKEQVQEQGEQAAWRFASTVITLVVVALAVVTVGGMVFAPRITALIAEGFNERQAALTTRLMRFMFPGVFAICLATVTYALLNSYNIFGYPAAGDAVQKMLWAGVFFVASLLGLALARMLDAIAIAFLLGAGATLLTHLLGLRSKLRFFRTGLPALPWRRVGIEAAIFGGHLAALAAGLWAIAMLERRGTLSSGDQTLVLQQIVLVVVVAAYLLLLGWRTRERRTAMAKFASLLVPLLFGILFAKYRDVLTNLFASFTGTGVFSDLKYARKIGEAPNTLVIAALSVAILPHLCELATGKKWGEFGDVMTRTIRTVVIFFGPLAAITVVLRRPIIQLLFDRGNWTDYHLDHAGLALGLYILSLPFFAIENPIQQSFFAMQRMWTPTLIGFLGTGFHILFLFVGIEWLGFGYFAVIALVYVAARAFKNIILLLVMRYHVKILPWRPSLLFLGKAALCTLGVVLAGHYTHKPIARLLPLDPYRRREVMIDTFNVEPRGWESDNVDDFRIVSKTERKDAALLEHAFGDPGLVHADNGLMARYRRSPRRFAGLRYDLSVADVRRFAGVVVEVVASEETELTLELVTRSRASFRSAPVKVKGRVREKIDIALETFGASEALADVVGLWIRDTTPVPKVLKTPTTLILDRLSFLTSGVPPHVKDTRLPALVEDFEHWPLTRTWLLIPGKARVEDTGERRERPELALHLAPADQEWTLMRGLVPYALRGCDSLRFKSKADKPCRIRLSLHGVWKVDGALEQRTWEATAEIQPSDKRAAYSVPIAGFKGEGAPAMGRLNALEIRVPPGVDFWLDNVAFVREPRGPRVRGLSLGYEVLKLVHVGVPSLVAFVVFVVLLFALRIEEAKSTWAWLRERALGKVLAKLRRRK